MRWRRTPGVERARGARVARGVVLAAAPGGRIVLGATAVIGPGCELRAGPGALVEVHGVLEERCRLVAAASVVVETGAHLGAECALLDAGPVFDDPERPVREQGLRAAPIHVGAGALVGPRAAILAGVNVGTAAKVLAQSVCTRDVPPGATVAGAPAHRPPRPRTPPRPPRSPA